MSFFILIYSWMGWLKSEIKGRNIERTLGMKRTWKRLSRRSQWKKIGVTNQGVLFWDRVHFLRSLFIKKVAVGSSFWVSRVSHNSFQPWRSSKEAWPVLSCHTAALLLRCGIWVKSFEYFQGVFLPNSKLFLWVKGICLFAYVSCWFHIVRLPL